MQTSQYSSPIQSDTLGQSTTTQTWAALEIWT